MKWQQKTIYANGINIFYTRTGGNKPGLVLNHGATDNGLCWMPVAKQLEADFDVIMPDARGHGKSDAANGQYGVVYRAQDLLALIETLHLENPAIMGHSMGAQTSLFAASMEGDKIRAAILEDPLLVLEDEAVFTGVNREDVGKVMAANAQRSKHSSRIVLRSVGKNKFGWPKNELKHWANAKKQLSDDFITTLSKYREDPDPWEPLASIAVPVLLLTGQKAKGGIVSMNAAEKAIAVNPHVQTANFDTGHNIRREDFAGFMAAVRKFLKEQY